MELPANQLDAAREMHISYALHDEKFNDPENTCKIIGFSGAGNKKPGGSVFPMLIGKTLPVLK